MVLPIRSLSLYECRPHKFRSFLSSKHSREHQIDLANRFAKWYNTVLDKGQDIEASSKDISLSGNMRLREGSSALLDPRFDCLALIFLCMRHFRQE